MSSFKPLLRRMSLIFIVGFLSACIEDGETLDISIKKNPPGNETLSYALGGSITGLTGTVTLDYNQGNELTLDTDGFFTFTESIDENETYQVSIVAQPDRQTCAIESASGVIGTENISNINITCSDNPIVNYSVGGTATGLIDSVILQINDEELLTVSIDGDFSFDTPIADGETFDVTIQTNPTGKTCEVSNGKGTIAGSPVNNVSVHCGTHNMSLVGYGISTKAPSIVVAAYHVFDKNTGEPVAGLNADDFNVLEDGVVANSLEHFKVIEPIDIDSSPISFYLKTVLAIDISASLSLANLNLVKDTVKAIIMDPSSGESRLLPNHQVAIYTFDANVTQIASFTSDINILNAAIDNISRGGPSTNLYGAISTGVNQWTNQTSISPLSTDNFISHGNMIVITNSDDTSGLVTEAEANTAALNKELYTFAVGSNVNLPALERIAGAQNVFQATGFSQLSTQFDQILSRWENYSNTYTDGLYFLNYATKKRAGSPTVDISISDNLNIGSDSVLSGGFNANGLTDVLPEVVIQGVHNVWDGEIIQLSVFTQWSNDPANYTWDLNDPLGLLSLEIDNDLNTASITAVGTAAGNASVTITDHNWGINTTHHLEVNPNRILISRPLNNSTFIESHSITFSAERTDREEGSFAGDTLQWSSSLDGDIDTRESFPIESLSIGTHEITVTVTDNKAQVESAAITIEVIEPYKIGDTGPAGGIVFYVTDNGLHGLEAAPEDLPGTYEYGCYGRNILGAHGHAIGTGATNTKAIVDAECDSYYFGGLIAANVVASYSFGGYTDWFLPSKDELSEFYLQRDFVSGYVNNFRWSSSQTDEFNPWSAYSQGCDYGYQRGCGRDYTLSVRPVRDF